MIERIFRSTAEISKFAEERHGQLLAQNSRIGWFEAWEETFAELGNAKCVDPQLEVTKYRKMINIGFTVRGERGAELLKSIESNPRSKEAFETVFGDGTTYLHKATTEEEPVMLEAIVGRMKGGKNDMATQFINTQDRDGNTALHKLCAASYNGSMGPGKPLSMRQDMARILIEQGKINTRLQNKAGETALGVLNSGIDLCKEGKTKYASRGYHETDELFDAIIADSNAMRETLHEKLRSGPANEAERPEHALSPDAPKAEIVDLAAFRRDKGSRGR